MHDPAAGGALRETGDGVRSRPDDRRENAGRTDGRDRDGGHGGTPERRRVHLRVPGGDARPGL